MIPHNDDANIMKVAPNLSAPVLHLMLKSADAVLQKNELNALCWQVRHDPKSKVWVDVKNVQIYSFSVCALKPGAHSRDGTEERFLGEK